MNNAIMKAVVLFVVLNILRFASPLPAPVQSDEGRCLVMTPEREKQFNYVEEQISELLLLLENQIGDIIIKDVLINIGKYTEESANTDMNFTISVDECADDNNKQFAESYFEKAIEEPIVIEDPTIIEEPIAIDEPTVIEEPNFNKVPTVIDGQTVNESSKTSETPKAIEKPNVIEEPTVIEKPKINKVPTVIEGPTVIKGPEASKEPTVIEKPKTTKQPKVSEKPKTSEESFDKSNKNNKEENYLEESNSAEEVDATVRVEVASKDTGVSVEKKEKYPMNDTDSNINDSGVKITKVEENNNVAEIKCEADRPADVKENHEPVISKATSKPGIKIIFITLNENEEKSVQEMEKKRGIKPFVLIKHGAGKREIKFL